MSINSKAQNTHRPYEAQEEGRPKYRYVDPSWKVDQNTHGSQPTNRLSIGSAMEQLEKGPKELRGLQSHRRNNNMYEPVPPELPGTKPATKEYTWMVP